MNSVLHPICAVVALLALAYKASALRRSSRDLALVALCCVLGFSALSFIVSDPFVWTRIDRVLGFPNSAALVAQGCVILLVASQQIVLEFWTHPPERAMRSAGSRLLLAALVLAVLVTLFVLMEPQEQRPKDFTLHYADHPLYAAYLLVYIAAYTAGEIEVARLSRQYARISHRLWLRRGLHVIMLGSVCTLGYSAIRIANLVAAPFSVDMRGWEPVAWVCGDIGALLTLVGWTLPGWGPFLRTPHRRLRALVQYRSLEPLWSALCAALPAIALAPPGTGLWARFPLASVEFRLYRRVIEIRDGQLALRAHADAETCRVATGLAEDAGLSGEELRAVVEAAQIAGALRAREHNLSAGATIPARGDEGPQRPDLVDETAWLVKVARAFHSSPVVSATLEADDRRAGCVAEPRRP